MHVFNEAPEMIKDENVKGISMIKRALPVDGRPARTCTRMESSPRERIAGMLMRYRS
jgi:hypothetical protein